MAPNADGPRRVWTYVMVASLSAGLVLIAAAIKIPKVRVSMRVVTDEVTARLRDPLDLELIAASRVSLGYASPLVLPASRLSAPNTGRHGGGACGSAGVPVQAVPVSVKGTVIGSWRATFHGEGLSLHMGVGDGAELRLRSSIADGKSLLIDITGNQEPGRIETDGRYCFRCTRCQATAAGLRVGSGESVEIPLDTRIRSVEFSPSDGKIAAHMDVPPPNAGIATTILTQTKRVAAISFASYRGEEIGTAIRGASTIYFPDLERTPVEVRPGDFLFLRPVGDLLLRRVELADGLVLQIEGSVRDLRVGPQWAAKSRQPTLLEFSYQSPTLRRIAGAVLTLIGLVTGALQAIGWLRK